MEGEGLTQILMCDKTLWSFHGPLGPHQPVETNALEVIKTLCVKYLHPSFSSYQDILTQPSELHWINSVHL